MERRHRARAGQGAAGARSFVAKTFDELCDSPFECGKLIERIVLGA